MLIEINSQIIDSTKKGNQWKDSEYLHWEFERGLVDLRKSHISSVIVKIEKLI